jgi:hypothetical protein
MAKNIEPTDVRDITYSGDVTNNIEDSGDEINKNAWGYLGKHPEGFTRIPNAGEPVEGDKIA